MELVISIALGAWISLGGWLAYKSFKKECDSDKEARRK